ncbi:MAG: delta-60 repeat domain-containing protein [Thermoleophilaceae bacterium]
MRTDATVGERVNGRLKTIDADLRSRRKTRVLGARQVRAISGSPAGRQTVVLARGVRAPRTGSTLVLPVSQSHPNGLLGRVVARKRVRRGRLRVRTVPTTLDKAYSRFRVKISGPLDKLVARTSRSGPRASASGLGRLRPRFTCKNSRSGAKPVSVDVDLSSLRVKAEFDANVSRPFLFFSLSGQPSLSINAKFLAGGECRADLIRPVTIQVGATPFQIKLAPVFKVSATGALTAGYKLNSRLFFAFQRTRGGNDFDHHVFNVEGTPSIGGSGKLAVSLGIGAQLTLGGRVGIGGELGPQVSGEASTTGTRNCITARAALRAALTASADVFVTRWTFTLAQGTFGEKTFYNRCTTIPAGPSNPGAGTPPAGGGGPGDEPTGGGTAGDVAIQRDGKMVVAGSWNGDFALVRYNPDGTLDPSFSGDGKQATDFGGTEGANGVAIQPDGRIVTVGEASRADDIGDFALSRHNPDGSLDPSFSGDGKLKINLGPSKSFDTAADVALQVDGKIVVVGSHFVSSLAVARLNPDGSLDTTFSGDGIQTTEVTNADYGTAVALQPDGRILIVGAGLRSGLSTFVLARYEPNGSLDASFSGDGKQTTELGTEGAFAAGVALQTDGKIVAVGGAGGDFAIARYGTDGSLDPGFASDGTQTIDLGGADSESARDVAVQADGRIVAAGGNGSGGVGDFALARLNSNGSLDTTFSGDATTRTDFSTFDFVSGVALQNDGRIVAAGGSIFGPSLMSSVFAVARYHPEGSLDAGFSGDGKVTTGF